MGLTEEQTAIIKATVPILETGGEALTKHFYGLLFANNPETKVFFNQTHQVTGTQPRALANSVLQYAKNIDNLAGLGDLPAQIIHKHVSLNIPAAGYAIVGANLLRAIREVLGAEVATDAVIDAWKAAYFQLAEILIAAEEKIYAERAAAPGGWRGTRTFVLSKKVEETPEITSFYWAPEDGAAILDYVPGQYIGMTLTIDGEEKRRNYSLSDAPNGKYYRITVKREKGGLVSNHLHDKVNVGDKISLFPPAGAFQLKSSEKPLVLIGAGIGLTPLVSMLNHTLSNEATKNRKIVFVQFSKSHRFHAFHAQLKHLAQEHPNFTYHWGYSTKEENGEEHVGRVNMTLLEKWLPTERDCDVYFLGPKDFMSCVKFMLHKIGVPEKQCAYEFFGPAEQLSAPTCPFAGKAASNGATCPFVGSSAQQ